MDNDLQLLDLTQLNEIADGDDNFKNELMGIFAGQIPVFINNMESFFGRGDLESLAREAHTAKSSALIFGMAKTGLVLKEIQINAESGGSAALPAQIQQAISDLSEALKQLKTK